MITKLRIQNFALIEDLTLNLTNNLVVFSGETGSGKSIIINAINFLIGERADKTFIRNESDFMQVDGIFKISEKAKKICENFGIKADDELLITRKISLDGKSEARANGEIITISMLKQITEALVDVCGQHQNQSLLNPLNHLTFLDEYNYPQSLNDLKKVIQNLKIVHQNLKKFGGDDASREREKDILNFELSELENAEIVEGEDEILQEKQKLFQHTQKLLEAISLASACLSGDDNFSVDNCLYGAIKNLNSVINIDKNIENEYNRLNSVQIELSDIKQSLEDVLNGYDFSEEEFLRVENRLSLLKNIKRKYGGSLSEALNYQKSLKEKLYFLENSEQEIKKLTEEKNDLTKKAYDLCEKITKHRKTIAKIFEQKIKEELSTLGMEEAKLVVDFKQKEIFDENGIDEINFMFSANIGEPLKPLTKVISGGEMSRFMLAFKTVLGNKNSTPTLLFDEIDSGIGGETGYMVGLKLKSLAKNAQVIVVTHLASIGAMADKHFKVFKTLKTSRTITNVLELTEQEKLTEIARLAGGFEGDFAKDYAKKLKLKVGQLSA
ncbi:MAG: DNA repair protein RecN [Clostridia bacterium]|nr:DNA repair protein RecN [Clostridia bacterium]